MTPEPARPDSEAVRVEVGQIRAIEGLRGIAVLSVTLFHYATLRVNADDPWVDNLPAVPVVRNIVANGWLGLELFFLITGFLLVLPWFKHAREGRPTPSTREFWRRRVRRIAPAYYVHLVLLFAVFIPLLLSPRIWTGDTQLMLINVAAHATFLQYTTPLTATSLGVNGALWTLTIEAQYYLVLPLLAPFFVKKPWLTAALVLAVAIAWNYLAQTSFDALVAWEMELGRKWSVPESRVRALIAGQLPGYAAHFMVGVMAGRAWLMRQGTATTPRRDALWAVALVAGLAALYEIAVWAPFGAFSWIAGLAALGTAFWACTSGARWADPVVGNQAFGFLGRISYSMYLYHLPLVLLMHSFVPVRGNWAAMPAYLVVLLGVSWLGWRYVEQPFMQGKPR